MQNGTFNIQINDTNTDDGGEHDSDNDDNDDDDDYDGDRHTLLFFYGLPSLQLLIYLSTHRYQLI